MLHVWEQTVPDIQPSKTHTLYSPSSHQLPTESYHSFTCAPTTDPGNALTAKNKRFIPSLSDYLGHVDQSASLFVSESTIHSGARVWQQAFPEVQAQRSPKHLVQLCESGAHPILKSDSQSIEESTIPEPQTRGCTKTFSGVADADRDGGTPAEMTQFSASLADGTIVHLYNSLIDLSQFKDLLSTVSKIWKQHSDEIIPHLSAQ